MSPQLRKALLLLSVCTAGAVAYACANPNAPPGGPPDSDAPKVVKVTPATGTIGAKPKSVVFQFDEVISETPKGSNDLRNLVFISPRSGDPEVNWRRSQLDVRPRKGWKPNTVYTVTLGAGVMDLRNNAVDSATRIVFSTGGPIPSTKIDGVAFDWQAGRPASKAIVEAIAPDSTTYQTISDSIGRYSLEHMPPGSFLLRAFVDRNTNRTLDPLEPWDTTRITLTANATTELYAFAHDTIGLRIGDLQVLDSGRVLRLTFDKPVALNQVFPTTQFVLQKADSSVLNIAQILTAPQRALFDSLQRKAREDSAARSRPADTTAAGRARRDSVARIRTRDSVAAADRALREARRQLALRGGRPLPPPRDTTPPPKMKRPALYSDLYLNLEKPLEPNTAYRITARTVRSLSGTVRSPSRSFKTPPKETPKDTTRKTPPKPPLPVNR